MFTLEELKKLDPKKLEEELESANKELYKDVFETRTGHTKANHKIGIQRKYIARIKTIITEQKCTQKQA